MAATPSSDRARLRLSVTDAMIAVALAAPVCLSVAHLGRAVLPPFTRLPTIALAVLWPAVLPVAWARLLPPPGVDDEQRGYLIAAFVMVSVAVTMVVAVVHGPAAPWLGLGLVAILLYLSHRGPR